MTFITSFSQSLRWVATNGAIRPCSLWPMSPIQFESTFGLPIKNSMTERTSSAKSRDVVGSARSRLQMCKWRGTLALLRALGVNGVIASCKNAKSTFHSTDLCIVVHDMDSSYLCRDPWLLEYAI